MTLTFKFLYNEITGQAWSMFDGDIENKDDFETTVTTSIQKALSDLWFSYEFEFRKLTKTIKTKPNVVEYNLPNGQIGTVDNKFNVKYDDKFLDYIWEPDKEQTGEPESFYLENNKFCLYPTPDNNYIVKIGYLSMSPAKNKDDEEIPNLSEDDDYINIDEKYEDLFKNTLLPLAMMYLIASESDENYSAYAWQYERAFKKLKKQTQSIKKERVIGW